MNTYKLVGCDTDSIKFCHQDNSPMTEEEMDLILKEMNDATPSGINLEKDGYYEKFLVIKSKNYVTFDGKKLKYKGSSILDSKKEIALLELMKKLIDLLLDDKPIEELVRVYDTYCKEAKSPTNIKRWLAKKTITGKVLNPERMNERKVLDAANDAIKNHVISGIQEGDKVYLYQSISGKKQDSAKGELVFLKNGEPKMIDNCILRFGDLYNQDHDVWHYVERVYKTLCILENVVDITKFTKYHLKKNRELLT